MFLDRDTSDENAWQMLFVSLARDKFAPTSVYEYKRR